MVRSPAQWNMRAMTGDFDSVYITYLNFDNVKSAIFTKLSQALATKGCT